MKINLLTDAPKHNLALMKISAWHKLHGDTVYLNMPLMPVDKTYASWIYEDSNKYNSDVEGGPGVDPGSRLPDEIESMRPDYGLYELDYSLGYTFRHCPRGCEFCKVGDMWPGDGHQSIWKFHNLGLKKICLLNNNTFFDPEWKDTFDEIIDAGLQVIDENGYDLRLMDDEKALYLKRIPFVNQIHGAFDTFDGDMYIIKGMSLLQEQGIRAMIYVLVGYNTDIEQDLYRCQKIYEYGHDPYLMFYDRNQKNPELLKLNKMIYSRFYRRKEFKNINTAWRTYKNLK